MEENFSLINVKDVMVLLELIHGFSILLLQNPSLNDNYVISLYTSKQNIFQKLWRFLFSSKKVFPLESRIQKKTENLIKTQHEINTLAIWNLKNS